MKSFHINILYIDAIVITVFLANGKTICINVLNGEHPSTIAASISSFGTNS